MASMATMGHCSVYVVLLQTAVEGPGFADVETQIMMVKIRVLLLAY